MSESRNSADLVTINTIVVAPVFFDASIDVNLDSGSRQSLTDEVFQAFTSEVGTEVLRSPLSQVDKAKPLSAAGQLDADAVLITAMHGYQERRGSQVGVSQPASVDFTMRLLRKTDGKELWNAVYHFRDQSLSENLLKLPDRLEGGDGVGWKKAREILQGGLRGAARELADARTAQFIRR